MADKNRILIIEDEELILRGLVDVFIFYGYQVDSVQDGSAGLKIALENDYDLIIIDIMLPGVDGFTICNRVRQANREVAIIILTAKTSDQDILNGFTLGADDYVTKPFSVSELAVRVEAVLRRTIGERAASSGFTIAEDLHIDLRALKGRRKNKKEGAADSEILFTKREIEVLNYLYANRSRPVSREELLVNVWNYRQDSKIETRTVDIHIAKLRQKIELDPKNPLHLVTVRGRGYQLNCFVSEKDDE